MLLQQIVETLDVELDRLTRLRVIVASLGGTLNLEVGETAYPSEDVSSKEAAGAVKPIAVAAPVPARVPRKRATKAAAPPRTRAHAGGAAVQKPKALSGPIPAGPVVVNAATLAREVAAKRAAKAEVKEVASHPPGSLGSMIRALKLDRPG